MQGIARRAANHDKVRYLARVLSSIFKSNICMMGVAKDGEFFEVINGAAKVYHLAAD